MRTYLSLLLLALSVPLYAARTVPANVVTLKRSASHMIIPAAGSVQGQNGTYFRSDISLINYAKKTQKVRLEWIPQNGSGLQLSPQIITLPSLTGTTSEDFVTEVMQKTGLGAIEITGVLDDGATEDATAQLYATSRIWTPQPGSAGTESQTFPTIVPETTGATRQSIIGVRLDGRYRANVGIVNLDWGVSQSFIVFAGGTGGASAQQLNVTVPARSVVQVGIPGGPFTQLQILVTNTTSSALGWVSYASSVDNVTGDAWSEVAFTSPADAP